MFDRCLSKFSVKNKILLLLFFFALPLGGLALYALSVVNREILVAESEVKGVQEARSLIQKSVYSNNRGDLEIRQALIDLGEKSKLILDPDLDSYYLFEVLFSSLPEILEHYAYVHKSEETKEQAKTLINNILNKNLFPNIENSALHDIEFHGENTHLTALAMKVSNEKDAIIAKIHAGLDDKKENFTIGLNQVSELSTLVSNALESLISQRIDVIKRKFKVAVTLSIISMALLPIISWLVVRNITRRISRLIAATSQTAQNGDLTQAVSDGGRDEVKKLSDSFNQMVVNLRGMVTKVVHTGSVMSTSISEIAAVSKQQQATSSEIAATTAELEATSRQIAATSEQLSKTMNGVQEVASETAQLTSAAQESLDSMQMTMQSITDSCQSISHKLETLNQRASKIGDVVITIAKVADQTNLLSLNAAIEAEKAGEFGHGFAVVAREIRRLADQTAVSTLDIEQMVKEIQSAVAAGVMGMEKFAHEVRKGANEVDQASVQFSTIIGHVQTLTPTFEGVSEGMQSQALGARQITESLSQLSLAARQTAESLTQSNSSIEQLHKATVTMDQEVQKFQLEAK